jgi:hypothetical protein
LLPVIWLVVYQGGGAGAASSDIGSAASSYTAAADARLVAADVTTAPPILFDPLFDGGASVAQAQIDSLGGTSAFAADPYPSSTALGRPGLLASNGFPSGTPPYPLVVNSDATKPTDQRQAGTVVLQAQSQQGSSSAKVTDGAAGAQSMTIADPTNGTVRARAEAVLSSLQLSSTLTLNGVRSLAEVTKNPSGALQRTASFEVSSLTILGQRVALTGTGLSLLGNDVPLANQNALLASLLRALADRGTTLEFIPPTEVPDGVTSAGLRITTAQTPPPQAASGLQSVKVQVTVGRASAFVTNAALPSVGSDVGTAPSAPDGLGAAAPSSLPAASSVDASTLGSSSAVPATTPFRGGGAATDISSSQNSAFIATDVSLGSLYPVLITAGLIGVAVVTVIRQLGVRQP